MTVENIRSVVTRLKRRYQEEDPERMCQAMGVLVRRISMGKSPKDCKGFFIRQSRIRLIVINGDLSKKHQRIILAHELGHAVLHAAAGQGFRDFALFDETSVYEYEANIFAAEFLLEDEAVLEQMEEETSFFQAAGALRVPPELLDFKFRMLKRRGYAVDPPLYAQSDFMKNIDKANRF